MLILLAIGGLPAFASTLSIPFSDSGPAVAEIDYLFRTVGNGDVNQGQARFDPDDGIVMAMATADYIYAIPAGSAANRAFLDLDQVVRPDELIVSGDGPYHPVFSSSPAVAVTIHAGNSSEMIPGNGRYDLLPLFRDEIVLGLPIHVEFSITDQFVADLSTYSGGQKNLTTDYHISQKFHFKRSGTLFLDYGDAQSPGQVPEPGSLGMASIGAILVVAGKLRRR